MARVADAVIAERAERIWDLLARHPEGMKSGDICAELELSRPQFNTARKWLERNLADERTQVLNYNPSTHRRSLATEAQPTRATARWLMRHLNSRAKSLEMFTKIAHDQFGQLFPRTLVRQVKRTREDVDDAIEALAEAEENGNRLEEVRSS